MNEIKNTIGQNHWNDDVIPFFPQERYNTIEVNDDAEF